MSGSCLCLTVLVNSNYDDRVSESFQEWACDYVKELGLDLNWNRWSWNNGQLRRDPKKGHESIEHVWR